MTFLQSTSFFHMRVFAFSQEALYKAYVTPSLLQQRRWPKWFTNEFEICNPVVGGEWKFVMIWPNGARHPNESKFVEVSQERIIIEHICKPHYVLTINLEKVAEWTRMTRQQQFDSPAIYNQIKWFVAHANEENFDRLEALLAI